jgi:hypothetical protein
VTAGTRSGAPSPTRAASLPAHSSSGLPEAERALEAHVVDGVALAGRRRRTALEQLVEADHRAHGALGEPSRAAVFEEGLHVTAERIRAWVPRRRLLRHGARPDLDELDEQSNLLSGIRYQQMELSRAASKLGGSRGFGAGPLAGATWPRPVGPWEMARGSAEGLMARQARSPRRGPPRADVSAAGAARDGALPARERARRRLPSPRARVLRRTASSVRRGRASRVSPVR